MTKSVVIVNPSLDQLAERANKAHRLCEATMGLTLQHSMAAGQALIDAKAMMKHGAWLPWLEENFQGTRRIASAYMRVAANGKRVSHSESLRGALKELAATSDKLAPMMSSQSNDWHTPGLIIDATVELLGAIDLDPCSNSGPRVVPAGTHYDVRDDGLAHEWRGRVYMNPPYGDEIVRWVQRLCEQYQAGNVSEAITLVPARTDTGWWDELSAAPVCFVRGRLRFSGHEGGAPFPSAVIYLGTRSSEFAAIFGRLGHIYEPVLS